MTHHGPEYTFPLYRPPAEADNLIVQATYGCSYNGCTFCSMYKSKPYEARPLDDVCAEIDLLAAKHPDARRVFLADGDALSLPTEHLLALLNYLQVSFTRLGRVSTYASAQNLLEKTSRELEQLREAGLSLIYYGIESGNDIVLDRINKGVDSAELVASLNNAAEAGMKISATVVLGMGGARYSDAHIRDTAAVVNTARIHYLSTLQLGLDSGVSDTFRRCFEQFTPLDDTALLKEQQLLLEQLDPAERVIFRSNHASNALHLAGTLPQDRDRMLKEIDMALAVGDPAFVPHFLRGF